MFEVTSLRNDYVTPGGVLEFDFDFPIYRSEHILVILNGTQKFHNIEYTVRTPGGGAPFDTLPESSLPSGGRIRFVAAPLAGLSLSLIPTQPIEQKSQYTVEGFPPKRVERDFDTKVMISRMIKEELQRAIKFDMRSLLKNISIDDLVANGFLRVNATGDRISYATGIAELGELDVPIDIVNGGTGGTTEVTARANLNVPSNAEAILHALAITKGDILVATGPGVFTRIPAGPDGTFPQAQSAAGAGIQYVALPASSTGGHRALGVNCKNNVATPNTQYDLDADIIELCNATTGHTIAIRNPATLVNNIAVEGVNGRDQAGAFSSGSFVRFYWIWNGSTLASISSAALPSTGPTLPSGYTHWAYACTIRYTTDPLLLSTIVKGGKVWYPAHQSVLSQGIATVETAVSLAAVVPPEAYEATINFNGYSQTNSHKFTIRIVSGLDFELLRMTGAVAGDAERIQLDIPNIAQQFFYLFNTNPTATFGLHASVVGYRIPNGDS